MKHTALTPSVSKTILLTCLLWIGISTTALAQWSLNNSHSQLNFISIKKGDVAEIHHFKQLSGDIDGSGSAEIVIDLSSVETLIPIRNRRMRELLFEVVKFPDSRFYAQLNMKEINTIQVGNSKRLEVMGDFTLHGQTKHLKLELLVSRLSETRLLVITNKPLLINAGDFALATGVEKLREVAGLPSISRVVPVSFALQFDKALFSR